MREHEKRSHVWKRWRLSVLYAIWVYTICGIMTEMTWRGAWPATQGESVSQWGRAADEGSRRNANVAFLVFRCFCTWWAWACRVQAETLGAVERLATVDRQAVDWEGLDSLLVQIGTWGGWNAMEWESAVFADRLWCVSCPMPKITAPNAVQPITGRQESVAEVSR